MNAFEENLWRDVVREYGADLARAEWPGRRRGRRARPRLLVGTTAGMAAVGVTLALLASGTSSPPAFAITGGPGGAVAVIASREVPVTAAAIARFNRALAALGARTGRIEKLIATPSGVEVRCTGPERQPLVPARIRTLTSRSSAGAASGALRGPITVIAWRCPGASPGSGVGASSNRALLSDGAPRRR